MLRTQSTPHRHARKCAIPDDAAALRWLVADYEDSFGIEATARRSPTEWAREIFEGQSPLVMSLLGLVAACMGLRTAPLHSPGHVFGMPIVKSTRNAVLVGADGRRADLRLVVVVHDESPSLTLTTFVRFHRRRWRLLFRPVLVAHRRVVPLLLERASDGDPLADVRHVTA